jgi:adenylate cyclase
MYWRNSPDGKAEPRRVAELHPVYEGRAFFWHREERPPQTELVEYSPTSEGEMAETWRSSVFFHLLQTGGSVFRVRFHAGETTNFPRIVQMRDAGMSAVVAEFPAPGS